MSRHIESLYTENEDLEIVGGKGRSLVRLTKREFKVPTGFLVSTEAYREFIDQNDLKSSILDLAQPEINGGSFTFSRASEEIQALILNGAMSASLESDIGNAYLAFGRNPAVAVRSSANAEDLPDLSFAGQQETFLNVSSSEKVVESVKKCWASLWTVQAINYRHQNGIDHGSVAMCVVVQVMVQSEVSGILFTANPTNGERSEMVINSSFGLGEAVVGGQVTPDTYIVDRNNGEIKHSEIGTKTQEIVSQREGGTDTFQVSESRQTESSLDQGQISELVNQALAIEAEFDDVPQDIEFAFRSGELHILQSRPITNLPVQPIELEWIVPEPATYVSRRQIVENMPDPICPLFEELYLTEGLESTRKGKSLMVGGGPMFITVNGYAYQRFDFPIVHDQAKEKGLLPVTEQEIDAAELKTEADASNSKSRKEGSGDLLERAIKAQLQDIEVRERDIERFRADLSNTDLQAFDSWRVENPNEGAALSITMPKSKNPTYVAFNNTEWNDRQLGEWHETTRPRLLSIKEKWSKVDIASASMQTLLDGIREMAIEEGYYWSSNASHTFGVAKSTDDQLQCFLRETLPDHHFISGQFLSGIKSKTMQANADLFQIAQLVRESDVISYLVLTTPSKYLMDKLRNRNDCKPVLDALDRYLSIYGHQGYSMDFIEATQIEDPSALLASLRAMVSDSDYDPTDQDTRATRIREEKFAEVSDLLNGLAYWQFRFRLWLARKYNYIREEVAFLFGYTWNVLRTMVEELGTRLTNAGCLSTHEDLYFLTSLEIQEIINGLSGGSPIDQYLEKSTERRELRDARKRHHPPGTLPMEASQIDGIAFKETQILNDEDSVQLRGFPVSSGRVTAKASVVTNAIEFDKMEAGTILVSPLTTPAWTQLFSHAVGLVTDVGSILAHGSIVAREYGIPAVLGVGNGTKRIQHGQMISIDGDRGTVEIHGLEA